MGGRIQRQKASREDSSSGETHSHQNQRRQRLMVGQWTVINKSTLGHWKDPSAYVLHLKMPSGNSALYLSKEWHCFDENFTEQNTILNTSYSDAIELTPNILPIIPTCWSLLDIEVTST